MVKPSLRDNFRYLLVEYSGWEPDVKRAVGLELEKFLGVLGIYETGAKVVAIEQGKAVVRVLRGQEGRVCAAFALANSSQGKDLRMRVLRISGTIEALCKKGGVRRGKRLLGSRRGKGAK